MTGLSNFTADQYLNDMTGYAPILPATSAARFLALFTTIPTDANSGGTEVTGGSYARLQIAGAVAAAASFTTSSTTITMGSSAPSWIVSGMSVYDNTNGQLIGTVSSYVSTTLTLKAAALHASSGSTDSLSFSAFSAASGTAPGVCTTIAAQTFATATASWGTINAWAVYDASTSGNLLFLDFLGNYQWLPFESTSVSASSVCAP